MVGPEVEGISVVMAGSFNPAIFQPQWLGLQGLIRSEEAESATITTIQTGLADFSIDWFHLIVVQERLQVFSADPRHYSPLRDLAAGIMTLLPHTPVKAVGLNRQFHFSTPTINDWHGLGHLLAPKGPWKGILELPGLRTLVMEGKWPQTSNGKRGKVLIKVEPSIKVSQGIYIEVGEEFRPNTPEALDAQWVSDDIRDQWDDFIKFSQESAIQIMNLIHERKENA